MGMSVNVDWHKPLEQMARDAAGGNDTLLFMASEARRLMNPFVPMDTGTLADNVKVYVEGNEGIVHYTQGYAADVYFGEGRNFSKEKHPLATAFWDKAAMEVYGDAFIGGVQAYINRG